MKHQLFSGQCFYPFVNHRFPFFKPRSPERLWLPFSCFALSFTHANLRPQMMLSLSLRLLSFTSLFLFASVLAGPVSASTGAAADCDALQDVTLQEFRWKYRVVVITAPAATDQTYREQLNALYEQDAGLIERDLRIISLFDTGCSRLDDTPISAESAGRLREQLGAGSHSFSVRLIGKDGGVKIHEQSVLPAEWLFAVIDGMPMRRREMREQQN